MIADVEGEGAEGFTRERSQRSAMPSIGELVDAGLLKNRQAEAFLLRELEGRSRHEAAESMGITPSTVDDHYRAAQAKIEAARETLALLPDEAEAQGGSA